LHQLHLNTYWTNGYIGGYPPRFIPRQQFRRRAPSRLVLEIDIRKLLAIVVALPDDG
jgi:hypothetical protein